MTGVVQVGVGCVIKHRFEDGLKFLIAQRQNSHGSGKYQLCGGHLEFNETLEECAKRESMEETNLDIGTPTFLTTTNDIMAEESKHYITVFMQSEIDDPSTLKTMEPHKVLGDWEWVTWKQLTERKPLFLPLLNLVEKVKENPGLQQQLGI